MTIHKVKGEGSQIQLISLDNGSSHLSRNMLL